MLPLKRQRIKKVVLLSLSSWRADIYYNVQTSEYEIMGIKNNDLKFKDGGYGISADDYSKVKAAEGISEDAEFCFSLYRNDRVKVINPADNESIELLFGSASSTIRGYAELKPIDRAVFLSKEEIPIYGNMSVSGRCIKRFVKPGNLLYKVNTDILGNPFYVRKEGKIPDNILDRELKV